MEDVTAIILTKNEERNITECIESIKNFVKRIVVVDSGSDDKTVELSKHLGADVFIHPFENYARQFNWALDNCNINTKWVLRIDADERFTESLCAELEGLLKVHDNDDVNGIALHADLYFLGKLLKYGSKTRKRKIMLFKYGKGCIEDRRMDEHTILFEGRAIEAQEKFIHYDFKDLNTYVKKLNWYAEREMQDYCEYISNREVTEIADAQISKIRKRKFGLYYKCPMFLRAFLLFIYSYVIKGGFLNGREGLIYCFLYHCYYRFLVDAKIYEHKITGRPFIKTGDLK